MWTRVDCYCRLVVLVVVVTAGAAGPLRAGTTKVVVCHGFRFVMPPGWHTAFPSEPCERFWNYPNERYIAGSVLPRGGAEIDILDEILLPGETPAPSLWAWMERELRRAGTKPGAAALSVPKETGVSEAIITTPFRWDTRAQKQTVQIVYWRIGGKKLEARVFWITGDPAAAGYREALVFLVRNMRPQPGG